jgi:hypothetical protein
MREILAGPYGTASGRRGFPPSGGHCGYRRLCYTPSMHVSRVFPSVPRRLFRCAAYAFCGFWTVRPFHGGNAAAADRDRP